MVGRSPKTMTRGKRETKSRETGLQQHRSAGAGFALWYMMALLALAIIVSYLDRA